MDLLQQTKFYLKKYNITPNKLKGQNFCIDQNVLDQMVSTAQITKSDTVLEVGPGFGFLTMELIKKAGQVIAVEVDHKLAQGLMVQEKLNSNFKLIEGDVLKITNDELLISNGEFLMNNYKIVANLPYSITSIFLKKFLTAENQPESMTLLLQKEVAERICAGAGEMSLLSISVQLYAQPEIITVVRPESFYPAPAVDSAIININNLHTFPFISQVSEKKFWQIVRSGFSAKRKTIENNLSASLHLDKNQVKRVLAGSKINPQARAQELSINDWLKVSTVL